jgi:hypothetical protein
MGTGVWLHKFLTSELDRGDQSVPRSDRHTPGEVGPGANYTGCAGSVCEEGDGEQNLDCPTFSQPLFILSFPSSYVYIVFFLDKYASGYYIGNW